MGEKIMTLARGELLNVECEIELNHATVPGQDQQVHIQTSKFRFEMDRKDYLRYALAVLVAERNLRNIKGLA